MRKIGHFLIWFLVISCGNINPHEEGTKPVSHDKYDALLKRYVDEEGFVDYVGLRNDSTELQEYLRLLEENSPNEQNWSETEQIAYWINAYNAYTLDLILDHYPLKSIKDIGPNLQVPFVNTPWDIKFINIAGEEYDLNNIEHDILRKKFEEPRIHFAIVCASMSCPKLRREAFVAERLDQQLDEQAREFMADPFRNELTPDKIKISKIFKWFTGDFTRNGSVQEFVNQFTDVEVNPKAKISYKDYDWGLNDQKDALH